MLFPTSNPAGYEASMATLNDSGLILKIFGSIWKINSKLIFNFTAQFIENFQERKTLSKAVEKQSQSYTAKFDENEFLSTVTGKYCQKRPYFAF